MERETYEAAFNEGSRKSQSLALSMTASLEGDGLLVVLPLLQAVSRGLRWIRL